MNRILAGLTVGLVMSGGVAWAENEAIYYPETGIVNIPKVSVGPDYYNVDMRRQGDGLDFLVTYATPATSVSLENMAVYTPGSLHVPVVVVGSDSYSVDFVQGDGYNFSVTGATLVGGGPGITARLHPPSSVIEERDDNNDGTIDSTSSSTITYNANGHPVTRNGQVAGYSYSPTQVIQTWGADTNNDGVAETTNLTTTYNYNAAGQLTSTTQSSAYDLITNAHTYNAVGQCVSTVSQTDSGNDGTIDWNYNTTRAYNSAGQLISVTVNGYTMPYTYNANGQLISIDWNDPDVPFRRTFTYDANGNLASQVWESPGGDGGNVAPYRHTYTYSIDTGVYYTPFFSPAGANHHETDVTAF
jgi:YD repeat-containing protein